MLVDTPQIIWHGGEAGKNSPVLSLDSHPFPLDRADDDGGVGLRFVLATAGTDAEVRLWLVSQPTEKDEANWEQPDLSGRLQTFVASLEGHQRGVNVVRFSPDGLSLASASDGGAVVIWSVGAVDSWSMLKSDRETTKTILRAATEDIYDIAWSPDSKYLACGSIDRRAHVWEVATKRSIAVLEDHQNYVQGTAWDPLSKYMATQSSDRSCRVYQLAQSNQDGGSGVSGVGRVTVKCCNVIKSYVVTPDEGGVGTSAGGERVNQGSPAVQDAASAEGTTCATSPEASPATSTRTQLEGGDKTCTQAAGAALDNSKSEALGVTGVAAPATAVHTAGDAPGTEGGGKGCGGRTCAPDADMTRALTKTNPVQRKNLFVDETVTSFFRRLSWSPDGAFLITPTAQYWDATTKKTQFCTYLFTRGQFVKPAVCLPGLNKPSIAVRCNPRLFCLKGRKYEPGDVPEEAPMCDLPYRIVFAVVSLDAVVVYDTEHPHPLTVATGLHYSGLTDACWSSDGLSLFVSSTDGYVSKIHFTGGELGVIIPESDVPLQTKRLHPVIYGSPEEALRVDDPQCRIPTPSLPSVADARGLADCVGSTPGKGEVADGIIPGEAQAKASNPHVVVAKPKKKIVPTLVNSLPAAASGRHPEVDIGQVTLPSTLIAPSPTPSTDVVVSERKKRRITPTLVHSNVDPAHAQCVDGGVDPSARDEMADTHVTDDGAPRDPRSTAKHASGNGQDRTPKKKRLAPTLVSAL